MKGISWKRIKDLRWAFPECVRYINARRSVCTRKEGVGSVAAGRVVGGEAETSSGNWHFILSDVLSHLRAVWREVRVYPRVNRGTLAAVERAVGSEAKKRWVRRLILNPIKQFTLLNISKLYIQLVIKITFRIIQNCKSPIYNTKEQ